MKCRAWGQESVCISVIARVCFSHFFMRFAGGLSLVRISGMSVIGRCKKRRESTVIPIGFCLLHALTSSRVTSKCILGFQPTDLRPITVVSYD